MRNEALNGISEIPEIFDVLELNKQTFVGGDNIAFLRYCKENMLFQYFHVGIVDPPYGISVGDMKLGATKNSKPKNYEMGKWDNDVPTAEYWELLNYCCRSLIVWGGNYFSNFIRPGRCCLVWDKMNNGMSFADFELALTTFDESARIIRKSRALKDEDGEKRHPTHKPVYLYDYIHLNFVERNQRVLDTHGGSHSHAIAAFKNDVNLTIIERDVKYRQDGIDAYKKQSVKGSLLF